MPPFCVVDEFDGVSFGDSRLDDRLLYIANAMVRDPSLSLPDMAANDSDLSATYRFLANQRTTQDATLASHIRQTSKRAKALGDTVLVAHDTSCCSFSGCGTRSGLTDLGGGKQGFFTHVGLVISADGSRQPLGVSSQESYVHTKRKKRASKYKRTKAPAPLFARWLRGIKATEAALEDVETIHLLDREGDAFELLSALVARESRFVIRIAQDRRLATSAQEIQYLRQALDNIDMVFERTVPIGKRQPDQSKVDQKKHPPRDERIAKLRFAATTLTLNCPKVTRILVPKTLTLNVVHVYEVETPEGETPIEWMLYTTEPIDSIESIAKIVDYYRARWVVEEFFKAIKTGCGFEERQLETFHSLKNALALTIPFAWHLLLVRHTARNAPDAKAETIFTERQILILQTLPNKKLGEAASVADAFKVIATWGGHLKQNGSPGWVVLGRGYQKLLAADVVWAAAERHQRDVINH